MLRREPRGYGMVGVSWAVTPLGRTVGVALGRWVLRYSWQTRANRELLDRARAPLPKPKGTR